MNSPTTERDLETMSTFFAYRLHFENEPALKQAEGPASIAAPHFRMERALVKIPRTL